MSLVWRRYDSYQRPEADALPLELSGPVVVVVVVVLGFYVPPTAEVIRRRDLDLKSDPKDWRSPGTNPRPLVYKASGLTTTLRRLLSGPVDR